MLPVNLFSIPLGIKHIFSFSIPLGIEHIFSFEQNWIQNCFVQNWIESGPDYFQMLSIYFISIAIILFLKGHYSSFEHNNFFGPRLVFLKVSPVVLLKRMELGNLWLQERDCFNSGVLSSRLHFIQGCDKKGFNRILLKIYVFLSLRFWQKVLYALLY